jgi:hypothetical protein
MRQNNDWTFVATLRSMFGTLLSFLDHEEHKAGTKDATLCSSWFFMLFVFLVNQQ